LAKSIDCHPVYPLVYRGRYKAEYPKGGVSVTQFIFTFLNGLTLAGLYFLVASGLTLIFGLMRVINLAHGAFYLLAGYVSWTIADKTDNWFYGAVAGALTLGVFGTLVYVLLLRKFQYEELRVALITLGVSLVLAQAMLAIFGGEYYQTNIPASLSSAVPIPGLGLSYPFFRIFVLILAVLVAIGSATVILPEPPKVVLKVPVIALPLATSKVKVPASELILESEASVIGPA